MSWAHSITTQCACVNNQPKVFRELEIQAPRSKEWECAVGDIQAHAQLLFNAEMTNTAER